MVNIDITLGDGTTCIVGTGPDHPLYITVHEDMEGTYKSWRICSCCYSDGSSHRYVSIDDQPLKMEGNTPTLSIKEVIGGTYVAPICDRCISKEGTLSLVHGSLLKSAW